MFVAGTLIENRGEWTWFFWPDGGVTGYPTLVVLMVATGVVFAIVSAQICSLGGAHEFYRSVTSEVRRRAGLCGATPIR